jgi:thioredoxin reductase
MNHYTSSNLLDVIIVCAGPKGLSAALLLERSLKQVLVIESGKPRNAVYHLACFQTSPSIACWIGEIFLMGEGSIARS